jgi:predicted membrane-bound mannosyltransferase
MSRSPVKSVGLGTLAAVALLAAACSHQQDRAGTTTVTSGSPSGVKVTAVRTDRDEAAMRLADELCARAAACSQIGDDARYRTEEACMADQSTKAPAQISRWTCTPTQTQAGFEECLAAIRSERCETELPRIERLIACRSAQVCGR